MEIRASFDAATLNLTANVAKSDGESTKGGKCNSIGAGVSFYERRMQFNNMESFHLISFVLEGFKKKPAQVRILFQNKTRGTHF